MPATTTEPADIDLMMRVKEGDLTALGQIFERHHGRIYRFCLRMVGNGPAAEDLVQEIFLRMNRYCRRLRSDSNFQAWMYRLARNVCNDHLRKSQRESGDLEAIPEPVSADPGAAELMQRDEEVNLLHRALDRLPEKKREVLILSRFERHKYEEIARLLDCSVGTVKVRVHRAVRHLREIYGQLSSEASS